VRLCLELLAWLCCEAEFVLVAGLVVALVLASAVPGAVGLEVAVADQGTEFEDGFGSGLDLWWSGDTHHGGNIQVLSRPCNSSASAPSPAATPRNAALRAAAQSFSKESSEIPGSLV
jgi:hypothetical protein